ncbi:FKBP-type peptidyl-prolyl cis-trans isomerase [Sulfurimonas sp. HSL-3221]|uniref:FKBP-type peptidyl-prolyl cis-trans isomerase n=1 Tax=Sulfurimonadaceae TaxID=2771471 RepID=UPI001E41CA6E|nr:FKBP-type peptidyl-prolyl cis-trans isomerase [Sulfurimonas sp. HSL-3221]UFS61588.1 FKBP-type peptidyl-prolyl cis-trans isomerase [Sulfurimonas sp. HSL-3221]
MQITKNTLVTLNYELTTADGTLLNPDDTELMYLHGGYGQIFPKLEEALEGKQVGDDVYVVLSPAESFGEYDGSLLVEEALSELPDDLEVGMEIEGHLESNPDDIIIYTVKEIRGDEAVLDGNHPLAGSSLVFDGTVKEIQPLDEAAVRELLEHEHHHH